MTGSPDASPLTAVAGEIAAVSPAWAAHAVRDVNSTVAAARHRGDGFARGLEAIREGWLIHRGAARMLDGDESPQLGLLIGDWCYAAGLCAIAEHGTLDDIAQLAAVVADISAAADHDVEALAGRWQDIEHAGLEDHHDGEASPNAD